MDSAINTAPGLAGGCVILSSLFQSPDPAILELAGRFPRIFKRHKGNPAIGGLLAVIVETTLAHTVNVDRKHLVEGNQHELVGCSVIQVQRAGEAHTGDGIFKVTKFME